jgi:hypothetical protein
MTQYQFAVNGQTDTGVYGWNASGSQASLTITDGITGTKESHSCTHQDDDMGRLASADCRSTWAQTFAFDPFGNLDKSGSITFNASCNLKNQIASVEGSFTPNYDLNGNLVDDPVASARGVSGGHERTNPGTRRPAAAGQRHGGVQRVGPGLLPARACNVAALLAAGADPNLEDASGHTALELALQEGKRDIATLLRAAGAVPR